MSWIVPPFVPKGRESFLGKGVENLGLREGGNKKIIKKNLKVAEFCRIKAKLRHFSRKWCAGKVLSAWMAARGSWGGIGMVGMSRSSAPRHREGTGGKRNTKVWIQPTQPRSSPPEIGSKGCESPNSRFNSELFREGEQQRNGCAGEIHLDPDIEHGFRAN